LAGRCGELEDYAKRIVNELLWQMDGADIKAICDDAAEIPLQRLAVEQVKISGEKDIFKEIIGLGK